LTFSGADLPNRCDDAGFNGTSFIVEKVIRAKLELSVSVEDIHEIGVAHYRWPTGCDFVAKFNRHDADSLFDRLLKASRGLSKKDTGGKTSREIKIWVRIAENKRDAQTMFLLRQMTKAGQAAAVDVAKSGKPKALVRYGGNKEL
jgi:hypothetical protein